MCPLFYVSQSLGCSLAVAVAGSPVAQHSGGAAGANLSFRSPPILEFQTGDHDFVGKKKKMMIC